MISADTLARFEAEAPPEFASAVPGGVRIVAPRTVADTAEILREAARSRLRVLVWGGGTHQGIGNAVDPDVVLLTGQMNRVVDWQPDDLTLVVSGGTSVAEVAALLDERNQFAMLPEEDGGATVGGVVAAGVSSRQRLRYGPLRDWVLQVTLATGDGRVVTAGGTVVKNVTGYDIPRLATGSLGALGVVGAVCLKLWPKPSFTATVAVDDAGETLRAAYQPLAVIETREAAIACFGGTEDEVAAQADELGGDLTPGLHWPARLEGARVVSLRVPPRLVGEAIIRIRAEFRDRDFIAAHGVGEVEVAVDGVSDEVLTEMRRWAESVGGSLVVVRREPGWSFDAWGDPPQSLDLQRSVKAAFDPIGVVNPGRLPGGL